MAVDATGTPTSPDSIPKYATAADAPSGKGFNAAMDAVQVGLSARVSKPAGIVSGEAVVWNGTTWIRSSTVRIINGGSALPSVTTSTLAGGPPGTPTDGDIWIATAVDAAGTRWQFQYNSGSASAFKWEFVGGPPFENRTNTQDNTASGTFVALATAGPTFTAARAGDYLIDFGFQAVAVGAGPANAMGGLFKNGADLAINVPQTLAGSGAGNQVTASGRVRLTALAATDVITMRHLISNGVNTGFLQRNFQVTPIRVS